jgi:hypothetical protein
MSEYHEILEADRAYLHEVEMRTILQEFVADAMEDRPANVYEYMASWARKKQAHYHTANEEAVEDAGNTYPTEASPQGAAHSTDQASHPDPSIRRHNSFDIGHPAKEVTARVHDVPEPEVSSKTIGKIAHAIEYNNEL